VGRPLKMLLVVPATSVGGAGESALNLLREAKRNNLNAKVVLLRPGPLSGRYRAVADDVVEWNVGRTRHLGKTVRTITALIRLMRSWRPDVVLSSEAAGHVYAGIPAWVCGVPAVWIQPGRPSPRVAVDRVATLLPAHRVVVASEFVAGLQRRLLPRRTVVVIPRGIDLERFRPTSAVARRDASLRVGMIGRLAPWKGQLLLLEAISLLGHRPDTEYVMIGGDDSPGREFEHELQSRVAALGLEDCVTVTGYVDDPERWYRQLDLVVHLSSEEPFGLVLIEAMANALPVVSVPSGAVCEVITDGKTGIVASARTGAAVADAIASLLDDPARRKALGSAAEVDAAERFSHRRMASAVAQLLSESAASR
jgi:glycosyltransferase involved in cell wall biosynthesis